MNKTLKIILLLWAVPMVALTQSTFTLNQLINKALEENYQLVILHDREEIAANNNTLGNAGFLPVANASGELASSNENSSSDYYTGDTRTGTNAKSSAINAMVEVNWIVFDGLKMFARKEQLEYLYTYNQLETKYYLEQTISDIAKGYYTLIKEQQILENYQQSLDISAYRLSLEEKKRSLGSGNTLLYNQALVDFQTDSALFVSQHTLINNLNIQLNQLVNQDLESDIEPASNQLATYSLAEKDSLLTLALAANKELKQAQVDEMIAETNQRIEAGDRYPEVSIFGHYSFNRSTNEVGFVEESHRYGPEYGIRVRFKLFDGGRETLQVKNASIEEGIVTTERKHIEQIITAGLLEGLNQHQSLNRQYQLTKRSVKAAEESLDIARQQLEQGAINGYDFRITQRSLLQVKTRLINLNYAILETEIDLLRMTGSLLERVMQPNGK